MCFLVLAKPEIIYLFLALLVYLVLVISFLKQQLKVWQLHLFFYAKIWKLLNFTPNKFIVREVCFHLNSLIEGEKLWSSTQLSRSQSHITNVRSQFCSIQNKQLVQTNEFQNKLILVFNAIIFFSFSFFKGMDGLHYLANTFYCNL